MRMAPLNAPPPHSAALRAGPPDAAVGGDSLEKESDSQWVTANATTICSSDVRVANAFHRNPLVVSRRSESIRPTCPQPFRRVKPCSACGVVLADP